MVNTKKDQNNLYGVIVKVENLNACRAFYRDILNLGAPVLDSNFWVEFKISKSSSLILEKAAKGEKLPAGRGRISWMCVVDNLEETEQRLRENGYEPISEEKRLEIRVVNYCDPESNPFSLCSKSSIS
jgi:predicted enzyme related to lactoylglutathione lyase